MKYIKKVVLNNFQSHKYSEIELTKDLNVIVGPSDQGKSAIIRGIKWVLFNEPTGTFFIRQGEKECSVILILNDGTKIKRLRTPSKNLYILYDKDGKESTYEGFGTNVPQEILIATGIKKILLSGNNSSAINIGEQLEGPFLLSEKNSTRANAIGRLVGVHIVDKAVSDTLKDLRNFNMEKRNISDKVKSLESQLNEYDYLDDLKNKIDKLEKLKSKIAVKKERHKNLNEIKEKLQLNKQEILKTKELINKLNTVEQIEKINFTIEKKIYNLARLKEIYKQYNGVISDIELYNEIEKKLSKTSELNTTIEKLQDRISTEEKIVELAEKYKTLNNNINYINHYLEKLKHINKIDSLIANLESTCTIYNDLKKVNEKIKDIFERLTLGEKYVKKFKSIDMVISYLNNIKKKVDTLNEMIRLKDKVNYNNKEISNTRKSLARYSKDITYLLKDYEKLLGEIEVCPVCFNKIDIDAIKKIVNSYK
ncbi:AAA family ATPase [Dethiothermospora halolimnae]|uniref:AAA family ATPase n=1 Tax=Dethiothermospora halolimnae TaxID=3114390 RepID=UPI003CCB8D8F